MTHRIPGGPSSASGAATTTVGVGAAVGSTTMITCGAGVVESIRPAVSSSVTVTMKSLASPAL